MEGLPACAGSCLVMAASVANCSITDIVCACENEVFKSYSTQCIAGACTVREAFFTQNLTSLECGVRPMVNQEFVPIILTFFSLTLVVVLMRVAARVVSQAKFWYDDYFNFLAFLSVSVYALTDVAISKHGFGVEIWAVPQENISYLLKFFLSGSCLYFFSRALIRVSILLFYLRIFRTPRAKSVITWTLIFNVTFSFTLVFPIVFQCTPVEYLWLQWDGTHEGHCINFRDFVWVVTSIGIALDFWSVIIASVLVSRLQLPIRKKIMVFSMFAVGLIAIFVSIARLPYINQFTGTKDPTIDWVPITIWSVLENYIGVICACLPSLPALLKPLSAIKISSSAKKSNLDSTFASQGTQRVANQNTGHENRLSAFYEMEPTYATRSYGPERTIAPPYGNATRGHQRKGVAIAPESSQTYLSLTDSE